MDTVVIKILGPRKFQIVNKSWFLPELSSRQFSQLSATEKQSKQLYLRHFVFHPPYQNGYLPRIEIFETLNKDRDEVLYFLRAEFSLPKLLYGNSLQEVSGTDFEKVLYALRTKLRDVGILIESEAFANARVSAIHFCKNVLLPTDMRMQEILSELVRVDISKVVDVNKKEFKHGGQMLHIYSGTREWAFYDKILDMMRPKVKRTDKGRMGRERGIVEQYGLEKREVFRYEYRVKRAQTVTHDINEALGRPLTTIVKFKDLFAPDLCKMLVVKSWGGLIQRPENQLALLVPANDLKLLLHIGAGAQKQGLAHSLNQTLISYGLTRAIRDHGAKEVRRAIFSLWNGDHPERLTQKIETAAALTDGIPYSDAIARIDAELRTFALISLSTLESVV